METSKFKILTATGVALGCIGLSYVIYKYKYDLRNAIDAFKYLEIKMVTTENECNDVVNELKKRCSVQRALGFDCEWVSDKGRRQPVALLQLASTDGLCGLFRLNQLKTIPTTLKELLQDKTVYKVGVVPADDAKYLFSDYDVEVRSTLDIRHIAELCGHQPGGLAALTKTLLNVTLDKHWRIRCSDWEALELTERQQQYAAADAHVSVSMFVKLITQYRSTPLDWLRRNDVWADLDDLCKKYADVSYKTKKTVKPCDSDNKSGKIKEPVVSKRYPHAARSKPLYHNCFMQAPDGESLCTCDVKKALWYVEKQLADVVSETPLTVRLRFEPAGRAVGEVGQYYRLVKHNRCVVCGSCNSYIRKNVVPREYRKYFPEIMKDHSSHDIVLLCAACHQHSNVRDQAVRARLAQLCHAPLGEHSNKHYNEDAAAKKIRSAARALLHQSKKHNLPEPRRKELEELVLQHYPQHEEITEELLEEACVVQVLYENDEYECHGSKVVEHFLKGEGGLLRLEQIWREHFLDSMAPKYLPELWSITHNEERLRVKWDEGRMTKEDLKLIGLTKWLN